MEWVRWVLRGRLKGKEIEGVFESGCQSGYRWWETRMGTQGLAVTERLGRRGRKQRRHNELSPRRRG